MAKTLHAINRRAFRRRYPHPNPAGRYNYDSHWNIQKLHNVWEARTKKWMIENDNFENEDLT